MKKYKSLIIKIVKYILLAAVFIYIFKYLYDNISQLSKSNFHFDLTIFIVSLLIYLIYKVGNAVLWHVLASRNEAKIPFDKSMLAWSYSQLGKFIPGKVFYLLGRVYYYKRENIPVKQVTFCFLLENAYTFISAAFIFVITLPFTGSELLNNYKWAAYGLIAVFLLLFNPAFLKFGINILFKLFKAEPVVFNTKYPEMLLSLLLFSADWMIMGIGFTMLSNSVYPLPVSDYFLYLTGSFALANVIGILSIFAPSGIGVREAIMVLCLSSIMPAPQAVIISVLSRVWITIGELLVPAIAWVYAKIVHMDVGKEVFKGKNN